MKFEKYFDKNITFQIIDKGITNYNYLSSNGFMIKQYSNLVKNNEVHVYKLVKDFDVETTIINKEFKITKFIDNSWTLEDKKLNIEQVVEIATTLRKLHDKKIKCDISFDPKNVILDYIKNIEKPMYQYSDFIHLIDEIEKLYCPENQRVLCHNDLTPGNLLFSSAKLYIIDWEYAGMNDPMFDVVSFLNENDLYNTKYAEIFLNAYFQGQPYDIDQLDIWNDFQNLMWCAWANMMYDKRAEQIYIDIAQNKMNRLVKND